MARGHYTFEDVKDWTREQWYFLFHYQEMDVVRQEEFLTNALGVLWDAKKMREQSASGPEGTSVNKDKLFIPLSLAVNPEILSFVNKQFGIASSSSEKGSGVTDGPSYIAGGSYKPKSGEVVKSMADMPKEEFLKTVGMHR